MPANKVNPNEPRDVAGSTPETAPFVNVWTRPGFPLSFLRGTIFTMSLDRATLYTSSDAAADARATARKFYAGKLRSYDAGVAARVLTPSTALDMLRQSHEIDVNDQADNAERRTVREAAALVLHERARKNA